MGVFNLKKKKKESTLSAGAVQTSAISKHPYYNLGTYMPMNSMSRVYQELKQAVPIIDSAIHKIIRLTGGFHFETGNDTLDLQINSFFDSVNVGGNQQGLSAFISNYLNQLLTFGTAIGEVILNDSGIYALYNSELESIELKRNSNGIDIDFYNNRDKIVNPQLMTSIIKSLRECDSELVLTKAQADSLITELEELNTEAELGREYKSSLTKEVIVTPFGAKVIVSTAIDDKTICAVDKNYALEKVQAGGITTEFDKLIDRQLERATISTITGFSVIYSDAIKILALAE